MTDSSKKAVVLCEKAMVAALKEEDKRLQEETIKPRRPWNWIVTLKIADEGIDVKSLIDVDVTEAYPKTRSQ